MGKKRIIEKSETGGAESAKGGPARVATSARVATGVLYVHSTYNNTKIMVTDHSGNALLWSSAGSMGFRGAKKGTPFAAAKVAEGLAEKALDMGIKEVDVVVRGVGSGRESSIRAFSGKGIALGGIKDVTPVPHNGPRPKKPRRV